jgi:MftR C-terminal domain
MVDLPAPLGPSSATVLPTGSVMSIPRTARTERDGHTKEAIAKLVEDPAPFLTRSRLADSVPAAHAHGRHLDAEYEEIIAEAVAASRRSDPATDLYARLIARAAWAATRAARDVSIASDAKRDPRQLINQAYDLLERDLRRTEPAAHDAD